MGFGVWCLVCRVWCVAWEVWRGRCGVVGVVCGIYYQAAKKKEI